ncbi:MAG: hypothetical protein E6H47_12165, partial [Betaproteobacteria bacterium]
MNDLNVVEIRKCGDDPQWILFRAQMADHANAELLRDRVLAQRGGAALHDHPHFASQRRGQLGRRHRLQRDQPMGKRERLARIAGNADVAVDIGAGQRDEQPPLRIARGKAPDRVVAAPGVQGEQQIRFASGPLRG